MANDVETEQIVSDGDTTLFTIPGDIKTAKPAYTSFLQHRGSIPLYWSQEVFFYFNSLLGINSTLT